MKKIIAFILVVVITCNLFAQQVFADPETLDPPVTAGTVEDDHDDPNGGDDESAAGAYGMYDADEDDTAPYISNYELLTIMTTLQGEMTNLQNEMASLREAIDDGEEYEMVPVAEADVAPGGISSVLLIILVLVVIVLSAANLAMTVILLRARTKDKESIGNKFNSIITTAKADIKGEYKEISSQLNAIEKEIRAGREKIENDALEAQRQSSEAARLSQKAIDDTERKRLAEERRIAAEIEAEKEARRQEMIRLISDINDMDREDKSRWFNQIKKKFPGAQFINEASNGKTTIDDMPKEQFNLKAVVEVNGIRYVVPFAGQYRKSEPFYEEPHVQGDLYIEKLAEMKEGDKNEVIKGRFRVGDPWK